MNPSEKMPLNFPSGDGPPAVRNPEDARIDVVIPVLNEAHVLAKSVATVCDFLTNHCPYAWKILIVDNGSTDNTADVARALAAEHERVGFFFLEERGRGRALREAWGRSTSDVALYIDVDLSPELAALPRLVDAVIREGYDISTGSRLSKDSVITRSPKREFISRVYNIFLKIVLRTRFSDAQCGFKAVSRRVVDELVPQVRDQSWFFDTELLVLAEKQGYRIKDVPIIWVEDDDSRVKIIPTALSNIAGVMRLRWKITRDRVRSLFSRERRQP